MEGEQFHVLPGYHERNVQMGRPSNTANFRFMKTELIKLLSQHNLTAPLRRELVVEAKVMNEKEGTVEFVASDETLDCYGEIVRANGWLFDHFSKNAPFVDSHDYSTIEKLLGQVAAWRVEKNQLIETVRYDMEPGSLGLKAFKLVRDGFLKAVSVGFVPVVMVSKYDTNPGGLSAQVAELKLDGATAAKLRAVYLKQQQIELSQCVIGANPNALAKAYKAGCLSEEDIDQLSALITSPKNVNPAAASADAGATSPRTRLAAAAVLQSYL